MDDYNRKKIKNQAIFELIKKYLTDAGKQRYESCGSYLEFWANQSFDKKRLYQANFCENRFCPMCAWRKTLKEALQVSVMMEYIKKEHDKEFIFITLTAPNVEAAQLRDEITRYNKAWHYLTTKPRSGKIHEINHGYARKLEITYNKIVHTYHPHFHIIMAVEPHYFKSREYISREKLLDLWQRAMNDPEITQVDIRKVDTKPGKERAVNELAKYAAKDSDYNFSPEVFGTFYEALKGRQVMTYNKLFKKAAALYDEGALDAYKPKDDTDYVWWLLYQWGKGNYSETQQRPLAEVLLENENNQTNSR